MERLATFALVLAVVLVGSVPALAQAPEQVPVAIVDCMLGGPCVGTSGNDTITGSSEQDVISGREGDDIIDPGNDAVQDFVFCGEGFDIVNQQPSILPEEAGFP